MFYLLFSFGCRSFLCGARFGFRCRFFLSGGLLFSSKGRFILIGNPFFNLLQRNLFQLFGGIFFVVFVFWNFKILFVIFYKRPPTPILNRYFVIIPLLNVSISLFFQLCGNKFVDILLTEVIEVITFRNIDINTLVF